MISLIRIMETNVLNHDCLEKFEMCESDWPNLAKKENLICPKPTEKKYPVSNFRPEKGLILTFQLPT